jgi:hypothetical protein
VRQYASRQFLIEAPVGGLGHSQGIELAYVSHEIVGFQVNTIFSSYLPLSEIF